MDCPLCNKEIQHPKLKRLMKSSVRLKKEVSKQALERLRVEGLDKDERIKDRNSKYYKNPQLFALDRLAFYICFKCKQPYFGGMRRCEEAGIFLYVLWTKLLTFFEIEGRRKMRMYLDLFSEHDSFFKLSLTSSILCVVPVLLDQTPLRVKFTENNSCNMMKRLRIFVVMVSTYKCKFCCSVANWFCWGKNITFASFFACDVFEETLIFAVKLFLFLLFNY